MIYALCAFLLVGLTALFGWEIYFSLAHRKNFECTLDGDRIWCISPSPTTGHSFDLLLTEITKITIDDGKVTLIAESGEEFWLTSNYGNPAGQFVQLIEQSAPSVAIERI